MMKPEEIAVEEMMYETYLKKDEHDLVNHPKHYTQSGIECIEVIKEATKPLSEYEAYCIGTIIRYLWRFKFKDGLRDLKKARWYLDSLIKHLGGEDNE